MKSPVTHRVVIDWLDLQVRTARLTNFWTVSGALEQLLHRPVYVEAEDEGPGRAASTFRVRLHDVSTFQQLESSAAVLRDRFGLLGPPEVTAVEVALDTYHAAADQLALAEIVVSRCRWCSHQPIQDWHLYRRTGEGRRYLKQLSMREAQAYFADGWCAADSPTKAAEVRYRAYVKVRDATDPLPNHKHRARFEVTLAGSQLPFGSLDQAQAFDFCTLASRFRFRMYKDSAPHPAVAYGRRWLPAGVQLGKRGPYRRRSGDQIGVFSGTTEFRSWTAADKALNNAIYGELRRLTRQWRSGRGADFPSP